jgi:hypothetical protein
MSTTLHITKERAIELFGSPLELAEALGIERANVYMWKDGEPIPQKHALHIRFVLKPEAFNGKRNAR